MKAKLRKAAQSLFFSAAHRVSFDDFWVRRRGLRGATVLMYHSIMDEQNRGWVEPKGSLDVETFERHVQFLAEHRAPVSLSDLLDTIDAGLSPPAGTVAVTFDDGYLDTLRVAGPILKRHGVPATVFVVSEWVGRRKAPWIDELHVAMTRRRNDAIRVDGQTLDIASPGGFAAVSDMLRKRLLGSPAAERDRLLRDIWDQLDPEAEMPRLLMDWDEIGQWRDLGPGFEVGVHTRTHPDMTLLSAGEVRDEVEHCARELADRFGVTSPHFAYPYGRGNALTRAEIERAGCRSAFATEPMDRVEAGTDSHSLTRFDAVGDLARLGFMTSGAYPDLSLAVFRRH